MTTDWLQGAQMFANYLDGDGPPERYARNAQRVMALALLTIAQELRQTNEHLKAIKDAEDFQAKVLAG